MSYDSPATSIRRGTSTLLPARWTVDNDTSRPVEPQMHLARRYELSWANADGSIHDRIEIAPALPLFEAACSAFTHGTLIQTVGGDIPIEDLRPGTDLVAANGQTAKLMWKSSITLVPGKQLRGAQAHRLFRITADAFGPSKPSRDLLLGPGVRRLARNSAGSEYAPMSWDVDGEYVIEVQLVQPTRVYHLMTDRHATILAGGLEVESYHPGPNPADSLSREMQVMFATLFPHLDPEKGFGAMQYPHAIEDHLVAV